MHPSRWLGAILLTAVVVCSANAQSYSGRTRSRQSGTSQVPRYTPASPTVSPYVNLLSRNGNVASNYFGLVRPLQRQARVNENQEQLTVSQQQELQRLREQQEAFEQPKVSQTGKGSWYQNFGQNPPFQMTDHFYGQWPGANPQQRRIVTGRH
jgi:hypothetical protein